MVVLVRIDPSDIEENTGNAAIVLGIFALAAALVSIVALNNVTHNIYTTTYYTFTSLFDATGIDVSSEISSVAPLFTQQFDVIVFVSVLDGITKVLIIGFVIAAIINMITSFDMSHRVGFFAKRKLKNHVIICGYSQLGEKLAVELSQKRIPFIIVDHNRTKSDMAKEAGHIILKEEFTSDFTLKNARIADAKTILFLTENDYENLLGVVTAHHLNNNVRIISRATNDTAINKMHDAGADLCVVPEVLAGIELGKVISSRK